MLSVCEVTESIHQVLPAPNDSLVHRVMGWEATKVQSMRTWMRNFAAAGVATQIKSGEHKSIATEIKPSQLPEAIETRVGILYVIDNDEVFGANWANLPKSWRTSYTPYSLARIRETIVRPAFDRVSRLNPKIGDSLKRILESLR